MSETCGRICGCHPLQHLIAEVIDRYEAPIPPPSHAATIQALRDGLADWKAEHEPDRTRVPESLYAALDFLGARDDTHDARMAIAEAIKELSGPSRVAAGGMGGTAPIEGGGSV